MAGEFIFYGATVTRSDDDGATWDPIPGVTEVSLAEEEQEYVDVTSLDSVDGYREEIPGLKANGTASMVQNYTREGMAQLEADRGLKLKYQITLANGDTMTFDAIRSGSPTTSDLGEKVAISNSLRLSGKATWAAGA